MKLYAQIEFWWKTAENPNIFYEQHALEKLTSTILKLNARNFDR